MKRKKSYFLARLRKRRKNSMDGNTLTVLGGFIATWAQLGFLYYKIGRLEQKIDSMNNK